MNERFIAIIWKVTKTDVMPIEADGWTAITTIINQPQSSMCGSVTGNILTPLLLHQVCWSTQKQAHKQPKCQQCIKYVKNYIENSLICTLSFLSLERVGACTCYSDCMATSNYHPCVTVIGRWFNVALLFVIVSASASHNCQTNNS